MKLRDRITDKSKSSTAKGGVHGCPDMYDLPDNPDCPISKGLSPSNEDCTKCWDRDIEDKFDKFMTKKENMSK